MKSFGLICIWWNKSLDKDKSEYMRRRGTSSLSKPMHLMIGSQAHRLGMLVMVSWVGLWFVWLAYGLLTCLWFFWPTCGLLIHLWFVWSTCLVGVGWLTLWNVGPYFCCLSLRKTLWKINYILDNCLKRKKKRH